MGIKSRSSSTAASGAVVDKTKLPKIDRFYFPLVPCNLPGGCSPTLAACTQAYEKWARGNEWVLNSTGALYHCLCAPAGKDEAKMLLASKHVGALYMLDELMENEGSAEMFETIMKVVRGEAGEGELSGRFPEAVFFEETSAELREKMAPGLFARYVKSMEDFLRANVARSPQEEPATVEEYIAARVMNALIDGILNWVEFSILDDDGQLADGEAELPGFRDLYAAIGEHMILVNDLFSFRKEYYFHAGTWPHNILSFLYRSRANTCSSNDTTLQDAASVFQHGVDLTCRLIHDRERSILRLRDDLLREVDSHPTSYSPALRFLAQQLPSVAAGNLRYSAITPRYNGVHNHLLTGELYHGTLLMHERATIILPPHPVQHHPYLDGHYGVEPTAMKRPDQAENPTIK